MGNTGAVALGEGAALGTVSMVAEAFWWAGIRSPCPFEGCVGQGTCCVKRHSGVPGVTGPLLSVQCELEQRRAVLTHSPPALHLPVPHPPRHLLGPPLPLTNRFCSFEAPGFFGEVVREDPGALPDPGSLEPLRPGRLGAEDGHSGPKGGGAGQGWPL